MLIAGSGHDRLQAGGPLGLPEVTLLVKRPLGLPSHAGRHQNMSGLTKVEAAGAGMDLTLLRSQDEKQPFPDVLPLVHSHPFLQGPTWAQRLLAY